jgi:hypothetical protein
MNEMQHYFKLTKQEIFKLSTQEFYEKMQHLVYLKEERRLEKELYNRF